MASKKKSTKKKARKAAPRRKPAKKKSIKAARKPAKKKALRSKPSVKKKASRKNPVARKNATVGKKSRAFAKPAKGREQDDSTYPLAPPVTEVEAGDLQGLSNRRGADSESVDELLEEGNAFEAGVVSGVEDADNNDEREVHTREVPEDDVPEEYLDED
jgi:hypothetical protein